MPGTRSASSPRRPCSTATTRRSTSCGGSCRARAPRSSTSGTTAASARSSTRPSRRTSRASPFLLPGRPRRVLRVPRRAARARRAPATCRSSGAAAGSSCPSEIERLREAGVTIFSPEDGQRLGLPGMVNQVIQACDTDLWEAHPTTAAAVLSGERSAVARALTAAETGHLTGDMRAELERAASGRAAPRCSASPARAARASRASPTSSSAACGSTSRTSCASPASRSTRPAAAGRCPARRPHPDELPRRRPRLLPLARDPRQPRGARGARRRPDDPQGGGFDLVVVETPGIGQGDAAITSFADVNLYVMTPEFGAASQLEKIDMLDFADVVAINKFERRGAMDALRDVGRQMVRNRGGLRQEARGHAGLRHLGRHLQRRRGHRALPGAARAARRARARGVRGCAAPVSTCGTPRCSARSCRRSGCATSPRSPRPCAATTRTPAGIADAARRVQRLTEVGAELEHAGSDRSGVDALLSRAQDDLPLSVARQLAGWSSVVEAYSGDEQVVTVRDKEIHTSLVKESLSGNRIRRVSLPRYSDDGDLVSFLRRENLPGLLPVHRRGLPVQAGQRGPRADVRRRGRPVPHQPPVQAALRGPARDPAVDGVRLGDALRPRPRQAPRHLRQGRHVRGLGRHARRHARAVRRASTSRRRRRASR